MSRQKKKTCLYCYAPLSGRRDAKTCSARCRKRLQRARILLERDFEYRFSHGSPKFSQPQPVMARTAAARRVKS
jgi:hypothetical protein